MKSKKLLTIGAMALSATFLLTGCAKLSDVKDSNGKNVYYNQIEYFGGNTAKIGNYIYFANGYTSVENSDFNYNSAKETGYLARVKESEISKAGNKDDYPAGIEKVSDKLAGFNSQYMFAYQSYLYFTSANTHKTNELQNDYTQVSFFRVKYNGDDFKELFTTKYDSSSFISANMGSDGNAYILTYAKSKSSDIYEISAMKIGDSLGKRKTLVTDVTSAVVENNSSGGQIKEIFYTQNSDEEKGQATTQVYGINYATGETTKYYTSNDGSETKLIAKIEDNLFYSYKAMSSTSIYKTDLINTDKILGSMSDIFYSSASINTINSVAKESQIDKGYVFISAESKNLMYKPDNNEPKLILQTADYTNILFVEGDYVYYSTDTTINRISVKTPEEKQTLVTMTKIIPGEYSYIDGYIYFFAQKEEKEKEPSYTDEEKDEYEKDERIYCYRIQAGDPAHIGNYQLVGKTKVMPKITKTNN